MIFATVIISPALCTTVFSSTVVWITVLFLKVFQGSFVHQYWVCCVASLVAKQSALEFHISPPKDSDFVPF